MSATVFQKLLEEGNVDALRNAWAKVAPEFPQPETHDDAEFSMHYARTTMGEISFKAAAYSHRWLTERLLPSGLADELKPKAERMYPVISDAVGISIKTGSDLFRPAVPIIRGAMETAVEECYADNRKDPIFIKTRMAEARKKSIKQLFGI